MSEIRLTRPDTTDEAATSINIYLSSLAQKPSDKTLLAVPANSQLARFIRAGPTIPEESIILSLSANNMISDDVCVNGSVPHPFRARQLRHGTARLIGNVYPHATMHLDELVSTVGGATVLLNLIEMAQTSAGLCAALNMLKDLIKDSWKASEEMERIRECDGEPCIATLMNFRWV